MGHVYRARDIQTGEPVALKILAHGGTERFLREGRVLAELSHPHIVRYLAHGTTETDEPYLAMEWLEGEDLARRLGRAGALPLADAVVLGRAVCLALAAAHARGVVHRDIKPSNLFLVDGAPSQVRVLDFGAARFDRTTSQAPTASGIVLGTPGYMAPEQVRDERPVDRRADVFALGCVLYEALTGRPAFSAQHVLALLGKILRDDPPRLREALPSAPAALESLLVEMLKKDPAVRLGDAGLIADTLAEIEAALGSQSAPSPDASAPHVRGSLVFRWWNNEAGDHFYTTDPSGELAPSTGYAYEFAPFHLFPEGTEGATPLYRWYSPGQAEHFYTTDPSGELAPSLGYKPQGVLGFVATAPLPGTVALHRWWHPTRADHFYTTDPSGELAPHLGYRYEGVSGYVIPAARSSGRGTLEASGIKS
jgi:serine/threonine protein kinase